MNLKTVLNFEVTKNERTYILSIPLGAPYGETYDAIFECLESVVEMQKKAVDQVKEHGKSEFGNVDSEPKGGK